MTPPFRMTPTQAKAAWSSMSHAERLAMAKTAPRVLVTVGAAALLICAYPRAIASWRASESGKSWIGYGPGSPNRRFRSQAAARKYATAKLLAAGYVLEGDE